jgi:guanylate kinase
LKVFNTEENMMFDNMYFITGTAYAGKSTLVKQLVQKYNGIACEENYHDSRLKELDSREFPHLTYTRDLKDWHNFIRQTPDEYEEWIIGVSKECEILELQILESMETNGKPVFVDTNISIETLWRISDREHVLVMLADPEISVNRFFNRPDREKQFLYKLLLEEENPTQAMENFKNCLARINSKENYKKFLTAGFHVILRDDRRSIEETVSLAEGIFAPIR